MSTLTTVDRPSTSSPGAAGTTATYAKRGVNPERLSAIRENAGRTILDAGCGSGAYVHGVASEFDICGVDIEPFDTWQSCPERFAVGNVCQLPFGPGSFETIVSFEVVEHLPNPLDALQDFHRICSKNVILTVPNCEISLGMRDSLLAHYHWTDRTHVNFFTLETISQLCRLAGFSRVQSKHINRMSFMPLLREAFALQGMTGWLLSKWLRRRQAREYALTCLVIADK